MANPEHLAVLKQGVEVWNEWRRNNPKIFPDLEGLGYDELRLINRGDELYDGFNSTKRRGSKNKKNHSTRSKVKGRDYELGASELRALARVISIQGFGGIGKTRLLEEALRVSKSYNTLGLDYVDFENVNLTRANLSGAKMRNAKLTGSVMLWTYLVSADLTGADLTSAILNEADLTDANLQKTNLTNAVFSHAHLIRTNLSGAIMKNCRIYGTSVWGISLNGTVQENLIITAPSEPTITVDNLEVAQFLHLLMNNEKIRDVIDTIARKVVLILGRFTPERKAVLDAIREELRKRDYLPVLFDFDKPATRDITETMRTLAHLSRFIIADLSDPKSIPLELQAVVPDLAVPVQPLLLSGQNEFSMFVDLRKKYHWVLATHQYTDIADLLASLGDKVITPAEQKAKELEKR